ncbi:hypothetical protein LINGRAHAP2_LOCUS20383, partial [Linum grandiflorum]
YLQHSHVQPHLPPPLLRFTTDRESRPLSSSIDFRRPPSSSARSRGGGVDSFLPLDHRPTHLHGSLPVASRLELNKKGPNDSEGKIDRVGRTKGIKAKDERKDRRRQNG